MNRLHSACNHSLVINHPTKNNIKKSDCVSKFITQTLLHFHISPKWELSPVDGEREMGLRPIYWAVILSIMKQSGHLSEHIPLSLLLDESFLMLSVHLWPFSFLFSHSELQDLLLPRFLEVIHYHASSGLKCWQVFIPVKEKKKKERKKITVNDWLIKMFSITMPVLISASAVLGLNGDCLCSVRTLTKMNSGRLFIEQINPQRKNSMGEGNHKETFKSKENRTVSAGININMS